MLDSGSDRGGMIGGVLGTSVGFVIWVYYLRHIDVFVAILGTWEI